MCVNLISPDRRYDQLYLSNFASLNVKDDLARIKGVGDVSFLGPRDYSMRIWLDPKKLAARQMTASDVLSAVSEQNVQAAAGRLGQPPVPNSAVVPFDLPINTQGRLQTEEEFANIILKTGEKGQLVYLRDVVRDAVVDDGGETIDKGVEPGAKNYDVISYLDGEPSVTLAVFQLPGSNALETAKAIRHKLEELKSKFPEGVEYRIEYDTTVFVEESVASVYHTLIEAFILVFIVVIVFLQDWRATILPMIDVPVSLIGTFFVMALMGFSLNNLSMFGLVLAIGIVVDDAIVVVENIVWARLDNNIFVQIGLVVLVGLAAKNAILIVEYAKQLQDEGKSLLDATVESCRLRLRPILMTSFAFILGVVPLVRATGAGAEMRSTLGIAVFSGMLGVTLFGIVFTPVFFYVIRGWTTRKESQAEKTS